MVLGADKQGMAVAWCTDRNVSVFAMKEAVMAEKPKQYQEQMLTHLWTQEWA